MIDIVVAYDDNGKNIVGVGKVQNINYVIYLDGKILMWGDE